MMEDRTAAPARPSRRLAGRPALPCNVRTNFDLEGEQVSRSREGQLAVSSGPSGRQTVTSAAEGEAAETAGKRT
jgi:hypothetical protein